MQVYTTFLEAFGLLDHGFHVFALNPRGKPYANCAECRQDHVDAADYEACECLWCHGCYAATDNPGRLEQMFEEEPDSLIGIRTGRISGLFVLDCDRHEGSADGIEAMRLLAESGKLPDTVTAATGGGGVHLYYNYPKTGRVPNDNRGKLRPGIDIKGDGGFVVAPPSLKLGADKPYSWAPGRSPEEMKLADANFEVLGVVVSRVLPDEDYIVVDLSAVEKVDLLFRFTYALDLLELGKAGRRNDLLHEAACRGGAAFAAGCVTRQEAEQRLRAAVLGMGLKPAEVTGTIRSGINRGKKEWRG